MRENDFCDIIEIARNYNLHGPVLFFHVMSLYFHKSFLSYFQYLQVLSPKLSAVWSVLRFPQFSFILIKTNTMIPVCKISLRLLIK